MRPTADCCACCLELSAVQLYFFANASYFRSVQLYFCSSTRTQVVAEKVAKAARMMSNLSWVGFWGQLTLSIVSAIIIVFSIVFKGVTKARPLPWGKTIWPQYHIAEVGMQAAHLVHRIPAAGAPFILMADSPLAKLRPAARARMLASTSSCSVYWPPSSPSSGPWGAHFPRAGCNCRSHAPCLSSLLPSKLASDRAISPPEQRPADNWLPGRPATGGPSCNCCCRPLPFPSRFAKGTPAWPRSSSLARRIRSKRRPGPRPVPPAPPPLPKPRLAKVCAAAYATAGRAA